MSPFTGGNAGASNQASSRPASGLVCIFYAPYYSRMQGQGKGALIEANEQRAEKRLLKKHVALIHSSGKLSLLERKLFNVLLLQAYDNLLTHRVHRIPLDLLRNLAGYDSKDRSKLKDALKALTTTAMEYNLLNDDIEEEDPSDTPRIRRKSAVRQTGAAAGDSPWGVATLVSSVELHPGYCEYAFIEKQAERYYNPRIWALINVVTQRQFTSSFALDLHENCLRFQRINTTSWWDVDTFRELVGATSPVYDDFRRLRNKVINVAVAQVNKYSEIHITPDYKRGKGKGRPVTAIQFHIKPNPQKVMFAPIDQRTETLKATEAYQRLVDLGCAERLALSAVAQDPAFALKIAKYTESKQSKGGLKNAGGYAASLLAKGPDLDLGKEGGAPVGPAYAPPTESSDRAALVQAFEKDRRKRTLAMASPAEIDTLRTAWVAKMQKDNPAMLFNRVNADGSLKGLALAAFEGHAVQALAGPYTDRDLEAWARSRGQ